MASALLCTDEGCPQHGTEHICITQQAFDELATEQVECFRCGEVVALIESEDNVCNWCHEAEHQRTEMYR